jgi:hypothetical protein
MEGHVHHEKLIRGLRTQLAPVLEASEQAMYAYLDDEHKFCNAKFAELLGYASEEEWANTAGSFPEVMVDQGSRRGLVDAYQRAMDEMIGSTNSITWKKKAGGTVESTVILVPIAYEGHLFALHYISA